MYICTCREVALSETCFLRPLAGPAGARWGLRWFTPTNEVSLCGHGSLATAAVLFREVGVATEEVTFVTLSGELKARREEEGIEVSLPLHPGMLCGQHQFKVGTSGCR